MLKFICFELFLLMVKIQNQFLLLQKNNRLFWAWQHYKEINLISILNFYPLQINLKRESLVNEPVLKVDHVQRKLQQS